MSQMELARRVSVSLRAVSYWEAGTRTPRKRNVLNLAAVLGVSPSFFYSRRGE